MKIFVELDKKFKNRNQVLSKVSDIAVSKDIIYANHKQQLLEAFISRENEFSTAVGNEFAIPHAVSKHINEITIVYMRFDNDTKTGIKWDDKNRVKYAICLLIPEKDRNTEHVNILSKIATMLMDDKFTKLLKTSKDKKQIETLIKNVQKEEKKPAGTKAVKNSKTNILAITACPVGIAHTYLAAEKIEQAAAKKGYGCKVETHGSVGVKNEFTKSDIENADVVIIAADVGVDTSRFSGKKVYKTSIKSAVDNASGLIDKALKEGSLETSKSFKAGNIDTPEKKEGKIVKHLLTGVSYMIPFIIFGGLLIALAVGLGKAIYGDGNDAPEGSFLWYVLQFGVAAFGLMIPILGGYIAYSIAGRAAIAPAMIVSYIGNSPDLIYKIPGMVGEKPTPLGFIGAILFGIIIGYTVKWINTWRFHKNVQAIVPIFIIPIGVTLFYALLSTFVIAAPISWVMTKFGDALQKLFTNTSGDNIGVRVGVGIGMGFVIGAMAGFDMGGPINKIAFVTCSALITLDPSITNPMGMMAAAIPVAPLAMGVSTLVYRKRFDQQQKGLGISSLIMGCIGISEGAIPFAVADPKRVFIANIVGSGVAGAIAGALGVTCAVAHGGPIVGILGAVGGNFIGSGGVATGLGILFFFIAIIAGTIVDVLVYGLLFKLIKDNKEEKENKNKKQNSVKLWFKNVNSSISESSGIVWMRNNKKKVAFSIMVIIAGSMLIMGSAFVGVEANNIGNAIKAHSGAFPQMGMYGLFALILGFVTGLYAFIYSFTVFKKPIVEEKVKHVNA